MTFSKIFVGGLGNETTIDSLKKHFGKYGELSDCVIMVDKNTNRSRGFGFITLVDSLKVEDVLRDQPHTIDGKQVECKIAIPKDYINSLNESGTNEDQSQYNSKKIFVGGLHPSLKENEMRQYFEQFGKIEQCVIMYDKPTGNSRGFGFILYSDEASADLVMASKNKHNIMGKWVDCKRAMPKELINSTQIPNQNPIKQAGMFPFNNCKDNSSFINGYNNSQINGLKFSNPNFNDYNLNNQCNYEIQQNQRNMNEGPYPQKNQHINQNYVVNNYYLVKNAPGTPLNNFNNIFEPEFSKDRSNRGYGVINNNYYYGPNTSINKIEDQNTPLNCNNNFKSSNIFSYEVPGSNNAQTNTVNSKSFQFSSLNNTAQNLNNSCDYKKNINLLNNSSNNINSNSMYLKNVNHNTTQEKTDKKYLNKEVEINLGNSRVNTNLSKNLESSIISSKSSGNRSNNEQLSSSSGNNSSLFSIFNKLSKDSEANRPNLYNYFYYKLFDNNGEDLSNVETSYKNIAKVTLFTGDESEKRKYEVMNEIDMQSVKSVESEDSTLLISNNTKENCYGPQKNKRSIKERNFKPY